jgi:hypothetical protein
MAALTLEGFKTAARSYAKVLSATPIPELFAVTDGKAVGTHVEHEFHRYLHEAFSYTRGSSASGMDFPDLQVDLKVTSIRQPQSSCPFTNADQKVYGLGYHLLVLTYEKTDDPETRTALLEIKHAIFIAREFTADHQTTTGIRDILDRKGNKDDLIAFLQERNLPLDEIGRSRLAEQILERPPIVGYLTMSNAQQWRLQYSRAVALAEAHQTLGVESLLA